MTGAPDVGGVGEHVAPYFPEVHRLRCHRCASDWRPVTSPTSWYGVCRGCGSDEVVVESRVVPGTTSAESVLRCSMCAASWIGQPGENCGWCRRRIEAQRVHQAEMILRPPEVELDDPTRMARLSAWAERLGRGVAAGIVTDSEARRALNRVKGQR